MNMKIGEELKLRIISGVILFSSAVFIVSLGGFFYTMTLVFLALFCCAELFLILGTEEIEESKKRSIINKGVFAIALPIISLYIMREHIPNGTIVTFWFFILVAFVDSFAYFTGKLVGKHRLAPNISPSKTVEGLVGGVFFATCFSVCCYYIFNSKLSLFAFIIMSVIVGVLAQISDLIESAMKRKFNIKNSSNLIPGHGGVLDRVDGYFLSAPATVFLYFVFKTLFGVGFFG